MTNPHRSCEHAEQECVPCFQQRIRSVAVAASATPSRHISRKRGQVPKDRPALNGWERGIPTDSRGMPFLDEAGAVRRNKAVAQHRHDYRTAETIEIDAG